MPNERPSSIVVERIAPKAAHELVERGRAVIVDVRTRQDFAGRRIAGAISIPLAQLAGQLGRFGGDRDLIFYCT